MNKILAIHLGHDGSITYVKDNTIIFHTAIDRYLRIKHFYYFNLELLEIISNLDFDILVLSTLGNQDVPIRVFADLTKEFTPVRNKIAKAKLILNGDSQHHLTHVSCLKTMESNIEEVVVIDGCGSLTTMPNGKKFWENESIFSTKNNEINLNVFETKSIGKSYENRASQIFGPGQKASKLMSLYQYGKFNNNYYNNQNIAQRHNLQTYEIIKPVSKRDQDIFDLAFTTQIYTEDQILNFFKKTTFKKLGYTGGVAQNVILNSKLKKNYNNLVIDPICGDMGISLGAANIQSNFKLKRKSIYLGIPQKLDLDNCPFNYGLTSYHLVCKLIENEPVAIFQSRSEQGQRGLGNRSLLMNADNPDCRKKMNKIKKREWFRPFALSILEEDADEYFENSFYSPYMLYIFKLRKKYRKKLKDGFAVDFTSRIQTVRKNDNFHYYNLLKEFKDTYNIPYLLNTSLNMPGHVLVEKLDDLYKMMKETNLNYAYLPEKQVLIQK